MLLFCPSQPTIEDANATSRVRYPGPKQISVLKRDCCVTSIVRSQEKGIDIEKSAQIMDPMALSALQLQDVILFSTYERNCGHSL